MNYSFAGKAALGALTVALAGATFAADSAQDKMKTDPASSPARSVEKASPNRAPDAAGTPSGNVAPDTGVVHGRNDPVPTGTRNSDTTAAPVGGANNADWQQVRRASKIIGQSVRDLDGKSLGDVKDIVLDPSRGRIAYAVLSYGGFMGMGKKLYAIPWTALSWNNDKQYFVLAVDRETLKRAPGFDKSRWPDMANSKWHSDVYKYYNQKPYWNDGRS